LARDPQQHRSASELRAAKTPQQNRDSSHRRPIRSGVRGSGDMGNVDQDFLETAAFLRDAFLWSEDFCFESVFRSGGQKPVDWP
jgi:hypothetical protein